jgi:toxin CcdB
MRQFDVLDNPIPRARRTLPFVAILQSDLAETGRERVVAPLAPREVMPSLAGRLIPIVTVDHRDYALLVPSLTVLPVTDLRNVITNLADDRDRIVAALDLLFIGI